MRSRTGYDMHEEGNRTAASGAVALFVPAGTTALREMRTLVDLLPESFRYEPIFFLSEKHGAAAAAGLVETGIRGLGPGAQSDPVAAHNGTAAEEGSGRSDPPARKPGGELRRFVGSWLRFAGQRRTASALLRREGVAGLVVGGDRHVGWETAFIREANRQRIPSLVVPIAWSDADANVRFRAEPGRVARYRTSGLSGLIVRLLFPRWIRRDGAERVLFQPFSIALAAWFHGMMPRRPWSIAGGRATRAAVESEMARTVRLAEGVEESKLVVTGKSSDDLVHRIMFSDRPRADCRSPEDGPLLLLAVPQLAEHRILPWKEHWEEMEFLFGALRRAWRGPILASLHPKSNPEKYRALAAEHGIALAEERIQRILPSCDVFVATYSSTVVQAIALAKPSVVVDFYGLDYTFYDQAPGVVVIRDRARLESELTRIQSDGGYRDQLAEAQRTSGADWCVLDGRCTERIVSLLEQLITARGACASARTKAGRRLTGHVRRGAG
ncbi:hypothetical protein KJ567_06610 [Candidatus Bipolaricaulota bacterium]|nr:hypothetical protein [Candidatus Bipolaricaulota bacterium]